MPGAEVLQTLPVLAYCAETAMVVVLAPAGQFRDGSQHAQGPVLVRDQPAARSEAVTLTVRKLHQARGAQGANLAPLLAELNRTRTVGRGAKLRLVHKLPLVDSRQPLTSETHPADASAQTRNNSIERCAEASLLY